MPCGISLHVARTIIDLQDGEITVASPPGECATVSFYVPGAFSGTATPIRDRRPRPRSFQWSRLDDLPEPYESYLAI